MNTETKQKCEEKACVGCAVDKLVETFEATLREHAEAWKAGTAEDEDADPYYVVAFSALSRTFSRAVVRHLAEKGKGKGVSLRAVSNYITAGVDFMLADAARTFSTALAEKWFETSGDNLTDMLSAILGVDMSQAKIESVQVVTP